LISINDFRVAFSHSKSFNPRYSLKALICLEYSIL
jgi:hypothetical protein